MRAADRLALSARGYPHVLRVARTIAELDGEGEVRRDYVVEPLRFRSVGQSDGGGAHALAASLLRAAAMSATVDALESIEIRIVESGCSRLTGDVSL